MLFLSLKGGLGEIGRGRHGERGSTQGRRGVVKRRGDRQGKKGVSNGRGGRQKERGKSHEGREAREDGVRKERG